MHRGGSGGDDGGNAFGSLAGFGVMGINYLIGFQALLNLQFLPSQFNSIVLSMASTFSLSMGQVAAFFFIVGTTFGYLMRGLTGGGD